MLVDQLKKLFGEDNYSCAFNNHVCFTEPKKFYGQMAKLKDELGFIMLLDVCGVDNMQRPKEDCNKQGKRFEAVYHLLNMETH